MADFVLDGGLFSRSLGHRGFRDNIQHKENGHGPNARENLSLRQSPQGTVVPLNEALRLNVPVAPTPTPVVPPAPPPAKAAGKEVSESSADELIRGYLDFLKSIDFYSEDANDPDAVLGQADKLIHAVTNPLGIADEDIETLNITSEYSLAEVFQQYSRQDGESSEFGAFYGAAAHARLQADITTKDGRAFHVELAIDAEVSVQFVSQQQNPNSPNQQCDPLTLDLDGDGKFSLSDVAGGIAFDINADGVVDQSAFVQGADAFLGLDRNGNGQIDDGGELFGDQHGAINGYAELSKFDTDQNGQIDEKDDIYQQLLAVTRAADGSLQQRTLASLNIDALSLSFESKKTQADGGNTISESGQFFRSSLAYKLADINLGYGTLSKEA